MLEMLGKKIYLMYAVKGNISNAHTCTQVHALHLKSADTDADAKRTVLVYCTKYERANVLQWPTLRVRCSPTSDKTTRN